MANKYDHIQELIGLWQEFEKATMKPDFLSFGDWLKNNSHQENRSRDRAEKMDKESNVPDIGDEIAALPVKQQLISLIARLARLQDFYAKKFFEGLPINSLLEFSFLFSMNKSTSLKKKEIIGLHLVEYSTGIDILNRLIRLQLVIESRDDLDKRSKRLKITSEGKRILIEALIRMNKINDLFFMEYSDEDLEKLLPSLTLLENHHKKIFGKSGSNSGFKILQLLKTIDEVT